MAATFSRLLLLLSVLLLTACTGMRATVSPDWDSRTAELLAVDSWEMRGRIAVKNATDGGQAKLHWRQSAETSRIRLSGPFGAGAYDLLWQPGLVALADANGEQSIEYRGAAAAEDFLRAQLGWSFPAGSTRFWVMGLLDPAAAGELHFNADGLLAGLSQFGWEVRFERFDVFAGYSLPTRLDMQRGDASVRMAISRWTLPDSES